MVSGPFLHITLEQRQILVSGHISFHWEGHGILHSGYLGCLVEPLNLRFLGLFDDGFPNLLDERLVCVSSRGELISYPCLRYFLLCFHPFVDVLRSFRQLVVRLLDLLDSSVRAIHRVAAYFHEMVQVLLGLALLVDDCSHPVHWVGYFHRLGFLVVLNLQHFSGGFQVEHVEVGRGRHFLVLV